LVAFKDHQHRKNTDDFMPALKNLSQTQHANSPDYLIGLQTNS